MLGDPLDAYVNGSQTWLLENGPITPLRGPLGPSAMTLEWRLHPVAGYVRPAGLETEEVFPSIAGALFEGSKPIVAPAQLWDGLEVFPAYGDEVEPTPLRTTAATVLGLEPDACGLVDHVRIGDEWERARGKLSIIDALLAQLSDSS